MNWFSVSAKKRSKGQRSKSNKATQGAPQQTFILEPLITPSGLVDSIDHAPHVLAEDLHSSVLPEVHLSEHSLDHASVGHLDTSDFHRVTEAVENHHTTKVGSHSHSVTHSTHASASDTVETHNDVVGSGDTHILAAHTVDVPISEHELEPLPFIHTQESTDGHLTSGAEVASTAIAHPNPTFTSGVFTVGAQGQVSLDYLFDGGYYQGQVAIFNLDGMDNYVPGSPEFIHEAAHRALSNSDLGHVVISDATEGARFSGSLSGESNFNSGEYQAVRSFSMHAGDTFGIMLVPNGTVQQVFDGNTEGDVHPLFSMASANPNEAFHVGQIADVTNNGHTFVMEDLRVDAGSDHDYNDIIFQVRGATGTAAHLDDVIDPAHDWRNTDMGQALIAYSKPYDQTSDHTPVDTHSAVTSPTDTHSTVTSDSVHSDAVEKPLRHAHSLRNTHTTVTSDSVYSDAVVTTGDSHTTVTTDSVHSDAVVTPPVDTHSSVTSSVVSGPVSNDCHQSQQPLIGVIDTGFSANNPDINYSHVTLGHDYIAGDANPLLQPGEGNEHGTHVLGIIAATKNNGIGIDGINDQAPIWLGRATGSGHWADSLVEFVNHAKDSGQPNAVVNLSLDLTQVNPDGSVTTRYEFTPQERAAIEYARQHDVLIVVAAGNDGGVMSALGQASQEFDNIITVGSAHDFDPTHTPAEGFDRADYSSYGYGLDIMADGGTTDHPVLSTVGNGVGTMAGTSVAAAEVTGGVSQVWAANPELSYRQVIELLKLTATDLSTPNWDAQTGAGLLNIAAAVDLAKVTTPEQYDKRATVIPDTWSGEGLVTPSERAASEQFNGKYYDWISDTVKPGDTLSDIAYRTMGNSTAPYYNFIAQHNGIANPNLIYPGQPIQIPKEVPGPTLTLNPTINVPVNSSSANYRDGRVNPFAYSWQGQCTWYVYGRMLETGLLPAGAKANGWFLGNAWQWKGDATRAGLPVTSTPTPGARGIVVWPPNTQGTKQWGHVAFLEEVYPDGRIRISEANWPTGNGIRERILTPAEYQGLSFVRLENATPKPTENSHPAQPGKQRQYVVRPGDTLWAIALRELGDGNRWTEITKADGSKFTEAEARNLQVGMSVYLPVSYQTGSGTPITSLPNSTPTLIRTGGGDGDINELQNKIDELQRKINEFQSYIQALQKETQLMDSQISSNTDKINKIKNNPFWWLWPPYLQEISQIERETYTYKGQKELDEQEINKATSQKKDAEKELEKARAELQALKLELELEKTKLEKIINSVPKELQLYAKVSIPLILSECKANNVTDPAQIAYILATSEHESLCGKLMEEVWGPTLDQKKYDGKNGNTKLGDGYLFRGRGFVQITGRGNYSEWSEKLGIDLENHPEEAAKPEVAAKILVQGMRDGTFTGKKLSDYINSSKQDFVNARAIINVDKNKLDKYKPKTNGQGIAEIAQRYLAVLT